MPSAASSLTPSPFPTRPIHVTGAPVVLACILGGRDRVRRRREEQLVVLARGRREHERIDFDLVRDARDALFDGRSGRSTSIDTPLRSASRSQSEATPSLTSIIACTPARASARPASIRGRGRK